MRKLTVILLCFNLIGCALSSKSHKSNGQLQQLEQSLFEKEQEVERLSAMLNKTEEELAQREAKIKELQKKLETFGVFE